MCDEAKLAMLQDATIKPISDGLAPKSSAIMEISSNEENIAALAAYVNFLADLYPPQGGGMMGMTPDEHTGMMISRGMHGGMMRRGMMNGE